MPIDLAIYLGDGEERLIGMEEVVEPQHEIEHYSQLISEEVEGLESLATQSSKQNHKEEFIDENAEYLATVEFQMLLSGESSVQPPLRPDQSHHEIRPIERINQKKTVPRLITARSPRKVKKEIDTEEEIEVRHRENDPLSRADYPSAKAELISPQDSELSQHSTNAQSTTVTTSNPKPISPRPSGHPSVKVRLWGTEQ